MVVGLAVVHYIADETLATRLHSIPAGVPVVLLVVPVGYAAARYGLAGSVATAVWATLLWLPDLLLPHDRGHVGNDVTELLVVIAVAGFVGYYIDKERQEQEQAKRAGQEQQAAEARYRQLFETNVAPILVLEQRGTVVQANPAATRLGARRLIGVAASDLLGKDPTTLPISGKDVITLPDAEGLSRDYRISMTPVPGADPPLVQLVLQDVTEELAEGQRARNFADLLLRAQEEERQRIARDLHDEPLQLIVRLARSIERCGDSGSLPAVLAGDLADARDQTLDLAARIRDVVRGLRPPALAQLGLIAALRGFLVSISEVSGLDTRLDVVGGEARMPVDFELGAFRIVQEAVNNTVRHAGADQLRVTITLAAGELRLRVADNGCGFDPGALTQQPRADRLGLLGMRERVSLLGGTLTVRSTPGEGTLVDVTLPVPDEAPAI
ncbi:MAG TPA: PAS domain-containing sensor histidine kinase [Streptosporangiaceae bacterium]